MNRDELANLIIEIGISVFVVVVAMLAMSAFARLLL